MEVITMIFLIVAMISMLAVSCCACLWLITETTLNIKEAEAVVKRGNE